MWKKLKPGGGGAGGEGEGDLQPADGRFCEGL